MERLTTNKNVSDMGMVELALNCCYIAKDGSGRYRDYEIDMDERDFVRKLTTTLVGEDLPLQDESFDEEMMDNLGIDPLADVRGLIAIFYRNMWAMAELREKLKRYEDAEEHGSYGKWIPVSERLPDDGDVRFYMCIVENHEEDLPMFCQYEEDRGFGFWRDYYDGDTLGFIDSEFQTNEELGYEKVVAWMPLPEPYLESEKRMANRNTLHSNKLDAFRKWLIKTGWTIEEPKGIWEVLRAKKAGRKNPLIVYQKMNKEHLSVLDRDIDVIKRFLQEK